MDCLSCSSFIFTQVIFTEHKIYCCVVKTGGKLTSVSF